MEELKKQLELFENIVISLEGNDVLVISVSGFKCFIRIRGDRYEIIAEMERMFLTVVFDKMTVYPNYIILFNNGAMVAQIKTV